MFNLSIHQAMHKPYKKITAQLLLFSFLLESCYNPNIGIGKRALPTPADPADKQGQYAGESHDKYPPKPPSHTWTTADKHPVRFTYHSGQWQAAIKEYAANGSSQHRQLPVVFEPGLTLEDVVNSNPTQQKQLLHLCPSQEDPDQPGYVYVGRAPSQAKPHPQLLSSPAARQTVLPSQVGLAQQQATAQPRQGETSPQQAQEQPGPQAVLALTGPVQEIGEGPRSQDQLPTTPARATSKPLPAPSSASPSQGVANTQPTSPQGAPTRRAFSLRNQHELLHSQRAAQAKRAQSAAMAKPGNQLAQPAQHSTAIIPAPSLAHKALQGIASQNLLAQGGHPVRFMHRDGQWWASVRERIGAFYRVWMLPVACERHGDVAKALADLQDKPTQYTQRRIHVMHTKQTPYVPQFVYLGAQGLQGGGNGAGEPSGSGEPQDEPATGGQEGAQGREPSQAAPQDREASLRTLQARMAQGQDITSSEVVQALHAAQGEEQQALQKVIQKGIEWFSEQPVGNLTPQDIQAYTCLAHIKADRASNRQLLASYFRNLCNKIDDEYQHGEELLIEALEYTLQNIDSEAYRKVLGTIPRPLMKLGHKLLDKLDAGSNAFTKENYPTDRSMLYALHQALVLIQQIAPGAVEPSPRGGALQPLQNKDSSHCSKYSVLSYCLSHPPARAKPTAIRTPSKATRTLRR